MFQEEEIREFQKIYLKHFGKEISYEEAFEYAKFIVDLFRAVYKNCD